MEYVVFLHRPDGTTGGAASHDFERPLVKGETITYEGRECVVDDVQQDSEPPTVWLRPT